MGSPLDVTIGLLGDVMLGRGVGEMLGRVPPAAAWSDELRALIGLLDLVVCNLECCLSARGLPTAVIEDKPFFFRGPPQAVRALEAAHIGAVGLANNHALDFGEQALADTIDALHAANIATAGAGRGPDAAQAATIVTIDRLRVGLVSVTDHPAEYAATPGRWGVAHASLRDGVPPWLVREISSARENCDLVILFPHWGPNMTSAPGRWQQRIVRELWAAGADLIAGHSAHVFHGIGWGERPVLYDLGDALDDYRVDPQLRNDLGVLAIWRPQGSVELELIGLRLEYCHTRLAQGSDADWIASRLERACRALGTTVMRVAEQRFTVQP